MISGVNFILSNHLFIIINMLCSSCPAELMGYLQIGFHQLDHIFKAGYLEIDAAAFYRKTFPRHLQYRVLAMNRANHQSDHQFNVFIYRHDAWGYSFIEASNRGIVSFIETNYCLCATRDL